MLLNLVGKDLKRALRNKKSVAILLVMPAVLITILGLSLGKFFNSTDPWIQPFTVGLVSLDDPEEGLDKMVETVGQWAGPENPGAVHEIREGMGDFNIEKILVEDILGSEEVSRFLDYKILEEKEAMDLLEANEISAVILIPKDFTYYTMMNLGTPFVYRQEIQVVKSEDQAFAGRIVEEIIEGFTDLLSSGIIAKNSLLEMGAELGLGDQLQGELGHMVEGVLSQARTITIERKKVEALKPVNGMQYYSVGQSMMFVLYVASYGAKYAFDEKDFHTYDRLRISNVTGSQILISRGISTFLMAFMQALILILYSSLIFRMSWGEPGPVLLLTLSVALAMAGICIFLTAINYRVGNKKVSNIFESILIMLFATLGGSFFSLDGSPILKKIGALTPNGTAINGYLKLMQGYGLGDIRGSLVVLLSIFLGFWVLARLILKQGEVA